jgi:hypothetical protein
MKTHYARTLFVLLALFLVALIARDKGLFNPKPNAPKPPVVTSAGSHSAAAAAPRPPVHVERDLPAWAVHFGKEFWRRPSQIPVTTKTATGTPELPASINLGDIMDRVTFAFRDENRVLCVNGPIYRAEANSSGVRFAPFRPDETREDRRPYNDGLAATLRTKRVSGIAITAAGSGQSEHVVAGNTVQRLLNRDGVIEHFETTEQGLAVSWIMPHKPASGDLTVDFEVAGMKYMDRTDQGHHFADASGTARVCVGKATLVDSSNTKWDLATHFADGALRITVGADLLARAQYPIAIDPVVMPEFGIDHYIVPTAQNENFPAVASNSGQFLVVWHNLTNIIGARISAAGELLDFGGILMSTDPSTRRWARLAATPAGYLVVWTDYRNVVSNGIDIYGTRVSTAGVVLDPNGIAISTTTSLEDQPRVANNGNESLVVWHSNQRIFGARVRNDGVLLDTPAVQIGPSTGIQGFADVACNGSDYLVAWQYWPNNQSPSDIRGARVSLANVPGSDFSISAAANYERTPAVASIGSDYFVVWEDNRIGPDPDVFGALVTAAGVGTHVEVSRVVGGQFAPAITASANNYFVVWQDSRFFTFQRFDIYGARVDATGNVLDAGGFQITTSTGRETSPGVAAGAGNYLVSWEDQVSQYDIRATFVSLGGAVGDHNGKVLTMEFPSQFSPALAFNGTEFLVAWMDYRNSTSFDNNIVFGARLNSTGQLLGSSGLLISRAVSYKQAIDVAGSPSQFLVVWEDRRAGGGIGDIYGCRVAGANVLDVNGIPITTAAGHQTGPAVATDGADFMTVWDSSGSINGARVAQNGTVIDPGGVPIGVGSSPDVAFGGGNFFVVWQDGQPLPHIRGARVNNGTVLDPAGISIDPTPSTLQRYPHIAFNGTHFLVAWQDDRNPTTSFTDIFSVLVDTAGTVLSGTTRNLTGSSYQRYPVVAAGGPDFLVVWNDASNFATTGTDLAGGRVRGGTGAAMDGTGFAIRTAPDNELGYAVDYAGNGNYLVVYESRINGVRRIVGRFTSGPPPGNPPLPGLFNTGVDNLGRPLPDDAQDPHYLVYTRLFPSQPYAATSAQGFPIPPWIGDNSISAWITPSPNTVAAGGSRANYSYVTGFDLSGYDPTTAVIVGQWATDNEGLDILINGQSTGQRNTAQFASFTPFRINSGFIRGGNTLTFVVNNADGPGNNPTGLRVEMEGTVAFIQNPVFHSIVRNKDEVTLTWEGRPGWEYIIQYNEDPSLDPRRWRELARVRAETAIVTYTDVITEGTRQRIYRVIAR